MRQLTTFETFDVHFPAIGPSDIVFEAGGRLYLWTSPRRRPACQDQVVTDESTLRPRVEKVAELIQNAAVSPTGKRAYFEARGDLFSVPAENGATLQPHPHLGRGGALSRPGPPTARPSPTGATGRASTS